MKMYALVDEDLKVARHRSRNKLAIFTDIKLLKRHAWRYTYHKDTYKIAELEIKELHELEGENR